MSNIIEPIFDLGQPYGNVGSRTVLFNLFRYGAPFKMF